MLTHAEKILLWSNNLWGFGVGILGPLYAVFATEVGGDVMELTWVYSLYLVCMGLGVIVVGKLTEKYGNEVFVVAGYALSAVAAFGYLLVHSMQSLLFIQILMAIANALLIPTWYALYDKFSGDDAHDGYIWGLSSGLYFIFQGIAVTVGGYLVSEYSFDVLFIAMGTVLTISTFVQAKILRYRVQ